jgi:PLP dependent protein
MSDSLTARYRDVCDRVAAAAQRSGRSFADIILVAVTKFADAEQIRGLVDLGHRDFGENKVQTLVQHAAIVEEYLARLKVVPSAARGNLAGGKLLSAVRSGRPTTPAASTPSSGAPVSSARPVSDRPIRWHMIGHLQRNKAKKAVELVRLIHSVDSLRLAEDLQSLANRREEPIDVLLQVNCSGEESKYGCHVSSAVPLVEEIDTMVNVRVRGFMTMAPIVATPEQARPVFARCREMFEEARRLGVGSTHFNILSMGMSGDFEIAIEEGANVVRVGSAIFGEPVAADEPDDEERDPVG